LQLGLAVEVIAITSWPPTSPRSSADILVFGESIGSGPPGTIARVLAFALVITGAALVPAPLRARSATG
jgi:hypothetical protein